MKTRYQGSAADYKKLSDEELVHRYVHRHEQVAMNFLFDRYGHLVLGVCLKYLEEENLYNQLEQAIRDLNREQRTCIEFFYLKKMTYAEITGSTGYTMQEVKSYLQNGKRNLKIKMEALADVRK